MISLNDIPIDMEAVRQYHRQRDAKRQLKSEADRLTWLTRTRDRDIDAIDQIYGISSGDGVI